MKYFFVLSYLMFLFQVFGQDLDSSKQLKTFEKTISKFIINDDFLKTG